MTDRIVIDANGRKYITREPAPRPWVGLTDEEIHDAFQNPTRRSIYKAIEAKLRSKNT